MIGNTGRVLTAVLIILAFLAIEGRSQGIHTIEDYSGRGGFFPDYAQFKSHREGLNRLEVYYRIFNTDLQFVRDGNQFRARYELTLTVFDKGGRQVTALSRDKSFTVPGYKGTLSFDNFRIGQFNLLLPPGKYKLELHLLDKNSGSDVKRTMKTELIKYDNREPKVSGIEFARAIDTIVIDTLFRKGKLTIIPSVGRTYSGDSTAYLQYYYEIYQGTDERKDILVETQILDRKMDIVYRDSLRVEFGEDKDIIRQADEISLWGLKSGEYTLEVALRGWRNRVVGRAKAPFSIYWAPEAMVLHDYEKAVKQLKYIAESEEMEKLKSAALPEERMAYWNEFWLVRDPSPGTLENEAKTNYYNRIEYANRHFRVMRKEGWRTDRGMILIKFGEPDQIEDFPFELGSRAYVIWYYYHLKDPRKFIFVDEWGDGDYQLQYPYDGRM